MPLALNPYGSRTAATTSGPAIGPRPASSTPATWVWKGSSTLGFGDDTRVSWFGLIWLGYNMVAFRGEYSSVG